MPCCTEAVFLTDRRKVTKLKQETLTSFQKNNLGKSIQVKPQPQATDTITYISRISFHTLIYFLLNISSFYSMIKVCELRMDKK